MLAFVGLLLSGCKQENLTKYQHRKLTLGIYQIAWHPKQFESALADNLNKFSKRPGVVMFYRDLGRPFPLSFCRIIERTPATPMISLELWHWGDRSSESHIQEIIDGSYDEFFRNWAQGAKAFKKNLLLRFGFEMNGNWFSWGARNKESPRNFIRAWRRVHDIFRNVGCDNVKWVFCPNFKSIPEEDWNHWSHYYPGGQYVDWVGTDGYNWGKSHEGNSRQWSNFDDIFQKTLRELSQRYPDKPQMIGEFGCAKDDGGRKDRWIIEAYTCALKYPDLQLLVYFNYNKQREGEKQWALTGEPEALKAYNLIISNPQFISTLAADIR